MKNAFYFGDNLHVLREYITTESVDLIYLDPPFNSNASYNLLFKSPDKKRWSDAQIATFEDTWKWGDLADSQFRETVQGGGRAAELLTALRRLLGENDMLAYLTMMTARLVELQRVLRRTGGIYLHCDPTASHYLKVVLDGLFGPQNFRNEIIWKRTNAHGNAKRWGPVHDSILFYASSKQTIWNRVSQPYDPDYLSEHYDLQDDYGYFQPISLTGSEPRAGDSGRPWRGVDPNAIGRHWAVPERSLPEWFVRPAGYDQGTTQDKLDALDAAGLIWWPEKGSVPRFKRYADISNGMPVQDVITDIRALSARTAERIGYPTQKPVSLLERIIEASSNRDEVVLDPFCGCGTTLHAAENLNRRWIGIDVAVQAMQVVGDRLKHAFPEIEYDVFGLPADTDSALWLAARDPFKFEEWACSRIGAMHSGRYRNDGGIDGTFYFLHGRDEPSRGIVSVKAGRNLNPGMVRDLVGTLQRERQMTGDTMAISVLVSAHPPTAGMLDEARKAGKIETMFGEVPAVQIISAKDIFEGRTIDVPLMLNTVTAAAIGRQRGRAPAYVDPKEIFRQRGMLFAFSGTPARGATNKVLPETSRKAG